MRSNGGANGGSRTGTNVFTVKKNNATDAAGLVGTYNFTVPQAPYHVERCDQILQIKGKKMDLNEYCIQTDAFMTLSIYMANLFDAQNPDKLVMSIPTDQLLQMPNILTGTTKCIKWAGKSYECTKGGDLPLINVLIEACDISKIDFTEKGPFGKDGPKYLAKIQEKNKITAYGYGKVDKSLQYDPLKLNKYYSLTSAPGTH